MAERILIVEDEPLVAMSIEDALDTFGYRTVGPAGTVNAALALIEEGGFDAAVLDVSLRGERVDAVADALASRGLPFLFTTGHGVDGLPENHRSRPMLTKPFGDAELANAVAKHLTAS